MYAPTAEQADADRSAAYEAGIPHGTNQQLPTWLSDSEAQILGLAAVAFNT